MIITDAAKKVAAAASLLALAGCGSVVAATTPAPATTAILQVTATQHVNYTLSQNTATCQDFAKQMQWLRANKATLTLLDIAELTGWIEMDAAESSGRLHRDLGRVVAGLKAIEAGGSASPGAVNRVKRDCHDQ
jgi:hypothetical protein